jgi:hypothetical protein
MVLLQADVARAAGQPDRRRAARSSRPTSTAAAVPSPPCSCSRHAARRRQPRRRHRRLQGPRDVRRRRHPSRRPARPRPCRSSAGTRCPTPATSSASSTTSAPPATSPENRQARLRRMELAEQRKTPVARGAVRRHRRGQAPDAQPHHQGRRGRLGRGRRRRDGQARAAGEVKIRIVHKGVGAVTENDVSLAEASDAIIIAFNVRPEANARQAIEETGVDLRQYSVIYQASRTSRTPSRACSPRSSRRSSSAGPRSARSSRSRAPASCSAATSPRATCAATPRVRVVRDGVVVADDTIARCAGSRTTSPRWRDRLRVRRRPGEVPGRQGRRRVRGLRGAEVERA